jgi:type IV pilus assembly protein PilE
MRPLHNNLPRSARAARGLTLIEIMVVVALIGILSSIALNSYQSSTYKSRRYAAQSCLMEQAQYMERYYTSTNNPMSYTGAVLPSSAACRTNLASFYTFSLPAAANSSQTFSVQAAAIGTQTRDTGCTTLSLNQAETRTPSTGCWP